jgi:hypothetical protein
MPNWVSAVLPAPPELNGEIHLQVRIDDLLKKNSLFGNYTPFNTARTFL